MKKTGSFAPAALAAALAVAAAGGCDDRETAVRSYPAPKDGATATTSPAASGAAVDARPVGAQPAVPPPAAAGSGTAAGVNVAAGTSAIAAAQGQGQPQAQGQSQAQAQAQAQEGQSLPFQWTLPEGWKQDPQPRQMRVATVFVESNGKRGELIVTRLRAGGFGGAVANINRWRQQVGLPPIQNESEVKAENLKVGGADAKAYDFAGTEGQGGNPPNRNRVVMVETGGDAWFFRFFGPADLVEQQRGAFDSLLQSVKFNNQG